MKNVRLFRTLGFGGLAACLLLLACAQPDPAGEADPAEVQRFLAKLDAEEQARKDVKVSDARVREEERKDASRERLDKFIEGASKRSYSPAVVNQVEETVVAKLAS